LYSSQQVEVENVKLPLLPGICDPDSTAMQQGADNTGIYTKVYHSN